MDSKIPKLNPCPKCGGQPVSGKAFDGKVIQPFVRCEQCGYIVEGQQTRVVFPDHIASLFNKWNKSKDN